VPDVSVLVVVPTYQVADNVELVLEARARALPSADVLVVDDASPDGTADIAEAYGAAHGGVEVLRRPAKSGLGSAYRAGFARGMAEGYDVLVEMDADLSHDPGVLPDLVAPLAAGHGLVIGSRYVPGGSIPSWRWHRRLLSRWGNRYASAVLGLDITDATSGFRAYRSDVLARVPLDEVQADGYGFQIEMAYRVARTGATIVEVPIAFTDRVRGKSKMSGRIVVEALVLVTWWAIRDRVLARLTRRFSRQPAADPAPTGPVALSDGGRAVGPGGRLVSGSDPAEAGPFGP
jgi:dolichol-phosphate mannosyltransferase